MNAYIGETGLDKSWQDHFPKETKCSKCGGVARVMFVAQENERPADFITDLHNNGGKGDYWVHDAIACGVYLCKDCFEPTAILNQA